MPGMLRGMCSVFQSISDPVNSRVLSLACCMERDLPNWIQDFWMSKCEFPFGHYDHRRQLSAEQIRWYCVNGQSLLWKLVSATAPLPNDRID